MPLAEARELASALDKLRPTMQPGALLDVEWSSRQPAQDGSAQAVKRCQA